MTDREILELAAKAAGIKIYAWRDGSLTAIVTGADGPLWNPLTDDGDALRLAVKLEIDLFTRTNTNGKFIVAERRDIKFCPAQLDSIDPYAATRRAIVRAAAEIGRSME